jgi:hypothetical protein
MVVDKVCKEYKLLFDVLCENRLSPLMIRSELSILEQSFKEEFYLKLEKLKPDKRPYYIKRMILFFEHLMTRIKFSHEFIESEIKKEGQSISEVLNYENSKLRSILYYDSRLHFNLEELYKKEGFDVLYIRITFGKYFMYNALKSILSFLESDHHSNIVEVKKVNVEKIKFNLNVDQMAILFRVLKEANIISKETSVSQLTKLISMNFVSKGSEQNSVKSISNKYYCDDVLKYRDVATLISNMDKKIEDLIKKFE